ncbi:FeoC-like transcriptional regulator [Legionella spiritensis]|uniref:FeoC-like transcriptional regulator n=1 Tax=Legionella spiritensis TaxID=452 RepID=UPI000F6D3606|nr:FeoC-like transcriptional regulator [Legionella spiritensis]VEG91371.1 FeoC like transcriptional regulator [Legionella spiritensis]
MLLQILDFIRQQKITSSQQLAREFHLDNQALQPMLEIWLRKGRIRVCEQKGACKSRCFKCRTGEPPVFYRYLTG